MSARHLALAAALVATALLATVVPSSTSVAAGDPPDACNGRRVLCGRSLGDVAFATTHNSMASPADQFVPPNQRRSMQAQLEHGIRGFQIDAYFGTPRGNRVYTDLSGPLGQAAELPPAAVRTARRVHQRLGAPPPGTPYDVYLCHVFCELGAVSMREELDVVRRFLDAHRARCW